MSSVLRFVGLVNAAIWFGGGIFFAAAVLPGVFAADSKKLFGEWAPYYSGAVALLLFRRFFIWQYVCGTVALLHLLAEKMYLGRAWPRFGMFVVLGVFSLGLVGGCWLQPRMERLRQTMYFGTSQEQKDQARRSFGLWHGISQFANLVATGGLLVHLIRVTRPVQATRYGVHYQIP